MGGIWSWLIMRSIRRPGWANLRGNIIVLYVFTKTTSALLIISRSLQEVGNSFPWGGSIHAEYSLCWDSKLVDAVPKYGRKQRNARIEQAAQVIWSKRSHGLMNKADGSALSKEPKTLVRHTVQPLVY
jgi:hypothetical protein